MAAVKTKNNQNFEAYKDTEILTANQGKLIIMLYEGAIRFVRTAMENLHPRTYDVVNTNIIKAQDIVTELMLSLNLEEGGEIGRNLFNLYAYLKKRLLEANMAKDREIMKEAVHLLERLKEAWDEVASKEVSKVGTERPADRTSGFSIEG